MIASLVVSLLVAQTPPNEPYVRSRAEPAEGQTVKHCLYWTSTTLTIHQNERGNPETTDETEFAAISQSWQDWQAVSASCGLLTLTEGARISTRDVGYDPEASDNRNIVMFRQKRCTDVAPANDECFDDGNCANQFDCWQYQRGTIALTTSSYDPRNGQVFDSDVELNDSDYYFTATTATGPTCPEATPTQACVAADVQNTMTHEFGHVLGLDHTSAPSSTMNPTAPNGETSKRALDDGSKQFICDVYPKGKLARDCVIEETPKELGDEEGCSAAGNATAAAFGVILVSLLLRRPKPARARS